MGYQYQKGDNGEDRAADAVFCRGLFEEIARIIAPLDPTALEPDAVINALQYLSGKFAELSGTQLPLSDHSSNRFAVVFPGKGDLDPAVAHGIQDLIKEHEAQVQRRGGLCVPSCARCWPSTSAKRLGSWLLLCLVQTAIMSDSTGESSTEIGGAAGGYCAKRVIRWHGRGCGVAW